MSPPRKRLFTARTTRRNPKPKSLTAEQEEALEQSEREQIRAKILMDGVRLALTDSEYCGASLFDVCSDALLEAGRAKRKANELRQVLIHG